MSWMQSTVLAPGAPSTADRTNCAIRILYLTAETWPTHRVDVAALFGKFLPRFGIRVDLVAGRTPGAGEEACKWLGGDALAWDLPAGRAWKYVHNLAQGVRHVLAAGRGRYHAIQVRDMPVTGAIVLLLSRWRGAAFFYWISYPVAEGQVLLARERGLSAGFMKWLFPWVSGRVRQLLQDHLILPYADHVFVQSARMKEDLVRKGARADRMTPVVMGLDLEVLRPEEIPEAQDARLAGKRAIVYLGTLEGPRRIELLFDMMRLLSVQAPDSVLVLVGDADDAHHLQWLKERAEAAGVAQRVIWTGWLPMREAWRYVKSAEVGVSPIPRGELLDCSSPTKLPEYLAFGLPVVCNDSPDQAAVMAASGAGRCVPYTAENFAVAAAELLALQPQQRLELGQRGRSYVLEHRNYERMARELAAQYARILGHFPATAAH